MANTMGLPVRLLEDQDQSRGVAGDELRPGTSRSVFGQGVSTLL